MFRSGKNSTKRSEDVKKSAGKVLDTKKDVATRAKVNLWVRPSKRFLDPPPPINFVHDLDLNYFQQKIFFLYYVRVRFC